MCSVTDYILLKKLLYNFANQKDYMNLETAAKIFKWCLVIIGICYLISISFDLMSKKSTFQNAAGLLLLVMVIIGSILISKQKKQN